MSVVVAERAESAARDLDLGLLLVIHEFDQWANPREYAFAGTCSTCWAIPEFAETEK